MLLGYDLLVATILVAQVPAGGGGGSTGGSSWSFGLTYNGTTARTIGSSSYSNSWQNMVLQPSFQGDFGTEGGGMEGVSISASGTVKCKIIWNGDPLLAPTRNYVQIGGTTWAGGWSGLTATVTASNDRETATASGGTQLGVRALRPTYSGFTSGDEVSSSLSASYTGGGVAPKHGDISVIPRFSVLPKYSLYNDMYEQGGNYHRGSDGFPELNRATPDGDKTLDSVVVLLDGILQSDPEGGTLNCGYGFWANEKYRYTLIGGIPSYPMSGAMARQESSLPFQMALPGDAAANEFGVGSLVKAYVTDADDSSAPEIESTYTVRWHLPYENWKTQGTTFPKDELIDLSLPESLSWGGGPLAKVVNVQEAEA